MASGTSGVVPGGEDDVEPEIFLSPSINGTHLTVNFPMRVPITCIIGNCRTQIKNATWTATVNNFKRHKRNS